jgi:glycosyltransferase involved in cell wall biosynthesis
MKLGFLCNEYPPAPHGGIGTSVQTLARSLVARGHQVTVLGIYPAASSGEYWESGVRVIQLPGSSLPKCGWLLDRLRLRRCLRRLATIGQIELAEAPDWQGLAWPANGHVPTLVRMNGTDTAFGRLLGKKVPRLMRWLEGQGLAAADGLTAVSRFIARESAAEFGLQEDRIAVIPNGIDLSRFSLPAEGTRDDALVVTVGAVTEKKGIVELIRAWLRVVARCPHARLVVVGRDSGSVTGSRSLVTRLRELLPPDAAGTVRFTGAVPHPEVQGWLQRAAVAVYPSFIEAQGIVWTEAMATGTPVLGSRLAGPGEELIEHGRSGLLFDPRDCEELAGQIIACLEDRELRARLGAAGRGRVEERFSTEVVLPQNEAFYHGFLQSGPPVHTTAASRGSLSSAAANPEGVVIRSP